MSQHQKMNDKTTKVYNPFYKLDLQKGQKIYLETDSAQVFGTFESFNKDRSRIDISHVKSADGMSLGRTKFYFKHQVHKIQLCGENDDLLEVPLIKEEDPFEESVPKFLPVPKTVEKNFQKIAENYKFVDNPEELKAVTEDLLSNQLVGVGVELVEQRVNLLILTTWDQVYIIDAKAVTDLSYLIPLFKSDVILKTAYDGSFFKFFEKKYQCEVKSIMNLKAVFHSELSGIHESFEEYVDLMHQGSLLKCCFTDALKETLKQVAVKWAQLIEIHHLFLHSTVLREFRKICDEYAHSHVKEEDCDVGITIASPENLKIQDIMQKHPNYKLPLEPGIPVLADEACGGEKVED